MERPLVPNYENLDSFDFLVPEGTSGSRLDQYIANSFSQYTRSFITKLIKDGNITINNSAVKPSSKVKAGHRIFISLPQLEPLQLKPEPIPLDILYEDECMAAVNKQADLVVHPVKGKNGGTLVNALLHHFANLSEVNGYIRPGIVHRLDRFTSGVILIAKTNYAHAFLAKQFEKREIQKEYIALTEKPIECKKGNISLPIAMDSRCREKMSVNHGGKPSETNYKVLYNYPQFSLVHVFPKTGRTHQIRVHLKSLGNPIVADDLYGASPVLTVDNLLKKVTEDSIKYEKRLADENLCGKLIDRQALHAWKINFIHPRTKKEMLIHAPLPLDFQKVLKALNVFWPNKVVDKFLS
ncbi:RluA family pseudouridine synthase [Candidatus Uabimicrobium sp. HlEnr_7]|uniref:RluA family pseudouridine synthase n=1 Tax=Candidatus Uabimicrobium helgolandensis TaxID=3095367 RepID=UPI003558F6AB